MSKMLTTEVRNGGWVVSYDERPCVAYWAERYTGRGDGRVHYFARVAGGDVVEFHKQMNRAAKLLVAANMEWLEPVPDEQHRHGPYGMYYGSIRRTREYPL